MAESAFGNLISSNKDKNNRTGRRSGHASVKNIVTAETLVEIGGKPILWHVLKILLALPEMTS